MGLFGLITRESATYPAAKEGVDILDEIATAKSVVETLRTQADIVVLLSHAGEGTDMKIAAEVPGIDVIVGGHSHSRMPIGQLVWRGDDLKQNDVNGTVVVQAFQWGGELGRLDLLFEKDGAGAWRVSRYRARLIPITPDLPAEPMVAAVVDKFWQPIAARYGEVIGRATADFSSRGDDAAPYHLVADAVRETFKVDAEFENTGGVRAPLVAGNVTRADLVTMDPFGNTIVLFKATGAQIKDLLVRNAPHVSGLRYRLVDGKLEEATIAGKPIEDRRTYTCATNSYFAGFALKGISQETDGPAPGGCRDRLRANQRQRDAGVRRAACGHRPPEPQRRLTARIAAGRPGAASLQDGLVEDVGPERQELRALVTPGPGRQAGLLRQVVQQFRAVPALLGGDLRQEDGRAVADDQHDPVAARLDGVRPGDVRERA